MIQSMNVRVLRKRPWKSKWKFHGHWLSAKVREQIKEDFVLSSTGPFLKISKTPLWVL